MGESTKNHTEARIVGIVSPANRHDLKAWSALEACDLVEFRADLWPAEQILEEAQSFRTECIRRFGKPMETIFTLRLARDGGSWPNSNSLQREKIWLELGQGGAEDHCEWVDLEMETLPILSREMLSSLADKKIKILASHHNLSAGYTPADLVNLGEKLLAFSAEGIKLAVTCRTRTELLDLMHFAREIAQTKKPICVLSMGALGQATRLLGPVLGCPLTYGYLSGGAVAPGQFSVRQMRNFFTKMEMPMLLNLSDAELLDWVDVLLSGDLLAE